MEAILMDMKVNEQKCNEKKIEQKLKDQSESVPHVSATLPVVLNVIGGHGGVGDSIVHDSVHRHRDWVTGEDLQGRPGLISAK